MGVAISSGRTGAWAHLTRPVINIRLRCVLSSRLLTFFASALLGLAASAYRGGVLSSSSEESSLERQLGGSIGKDVVRGSLVLLEAIQGEPGLDTAVFWKKASFLATNEEGGQKDLFSAQLRIAPDDVLVGVRRIVNLTNTPDGDESVMASAGDRVAVAAKVLGQVRTITVLDFAGSRSTRGAEWGRLEAKLAGITDWLETGQVQGLGRTTIVFEMPPDAVDLAFAGPASSDPLVIRWKNRVGREETARVDVAAASQAEHAGLIVSEDRRSPKEPLLWFVDTARSMPFIGPGPIAWAEGRFFVLRDILKRWSYAARGEKEPTQTARADLRVEVGQDDLGGAEHVTWPPRPLTSVAFEENEAGEGQWRPAAPSWLKALPGAPPAFYKTYLRVDGDRPYVKAHFIAMDMRQMDLHMVGGLADPRPTTGARGTGKLPRDPETLSRVVAAFNGAFKTEHGAYGMMEERRILLPPVAEAATVATMEDGTAKMGSWPAGRPIPKNMRSYRQNLDPLVDGGVLNPKKRDKWGRTPYTSVTYMNTIRSGLCMSGDGMLLYVWGDDLTAQTLGIAMNVAGCEYGMHLDMNPFHTAFVYYHFADAIAQGSGEEVPEYQASLALRRMSYYPQTYVEGSLKDFFYLTLKNYGLDGWSSLGLGQAEPDFLPVLQKRIEGSVRLFAVDLSRADVRLLPGEIPEKLAPHLGGKELIEPEDVLMAVSLGRWHADRGQLVDGTVVGRLEVGRPTVALSEERGLLLGQWPMAGLGKRGAFNALQGDDIGRLSGETALAVGKLPCGWLVVGSGPTADLGAAFRGHGAQTIWAMDAGGDEARIVVRGQEAMLDGVSDRPVREIDGVHSLLLLTARSTRLGVSRLESEF